MPLPFLPLVCTNVPYLNESVDEVTWTGELLVLVEEFVERADVEALEFSGDARRRRVTDDACRSQGVDQPAPFGNADRRRRRRRCGIRHVARHKHRIVHASNRQNIIIIIVIINESFY